MIKTRREVVVGRAMFGKGRRPKLLALAACAALSLGGCADLPLDGEQEDIGETQSALTTYARKALLITDLSVVRDAARTSDPCDAPAGAENRVWTIGHMLKVEAARQGKSANDYVKNWLDAWATSTTINNQTFTLDKLTGPQVRSNWPKDSNGNYRLHKAPLKLLAIVNRLDLRTVRPNGEPLGGEVRFIFSPMLSTTLVNPPPADGRCMTSADDNSTVILEYSPAKLDENAVVAWAKKWHALGSMPWGATYRSELAKLTEEVLTDGRLLRIRTNEGPTGFWNLTEFDHHPSTKFLRRTTVKQSPTEALRTQNQSLLGQWIRDNKYAIQGTKPVPRTYLGYPVPNYWLTNTFPSPNTGIYLRGAFNELDSALQKGFWSPPNPGVWQGEWDELRHLFSLQTCSGCHGRETATGLLHVKNNNQGAAGISDFLNGPLTVTDPVSGQSRQFDEMGRREEDLKWLVSDGWVGVPTVRTPPTGAFGALAGINYKAVFWHSSKCMDVAGISQNNGALVKQYTCHGGDNQRVGLFDLGQSVYNVVFKHSGKCLDVENGSTAERARVVQMPCNPNSASQKVVTWFSSPGPGGRILKFQHSGKCLRVDGNGTGEGVQVVQETCADGSPNNRSFKLIE